MIEVDKSLINSFSEAAKQEVFLNSFSKISAYINESMEKIISNNPHIKTYNLFVANEVFSGTEISGSNLDIFLCLVAKQLELNLIEKKSYRFNNSIKLFLKTFKENFKIFKKRKKSEKKIIKEEKRLSEISDEKYNIKTFMYDLQIQLCKKLYKTSKIGLSHNKLIIKGKDEFGLSISIYPVFIDTNLYKLYNINNGKITKIDFEDRFNNWESFNRKTKTLFKIQVRIFNHLYFNIIKQNPNQIFIESLLYNVPYDFYTTNIYETTLRIINYLKNSDISKFASICNENVKLFKEPLNTIFLENAYRFIRTIKVKNN